MRCWIRCAPKTTALAGTPRVFRGDVERDWAPGLAIGTPAWVAFNADRDVWVSDHGPLLASPVPSAATLVGGIGAHCVYAVRHDSIEGPGQWVPIRAALIEAADDAFMAIQAGIQRLEFAEEHRFCGRCGSATENSSSDMGKQCPSCALVAYPRVAPSIIVLVTRGDQALLGRSPRFVEGMYSTLAGFIEAGESAEHAIRREVMEEVGVRVTAPRYFATQSWPFKHSLMMGYFADWESGEITVDGVEIEDAQWFSRDQLPPLPPRASISRALIDTWIAS